MREITSACTATGFNKGVWVTKKEHQRKQHQEELERVYKSGWDNGREHGYSVGFAAAGKVAAEDAKRLKQEQNIKLQRAEAIIAVAQAITHLS